MQDIKNYFGFDHGVNWQLVGANKTFKTAAYLAPLRNCKAQEVFSLIPIPHCTVFIVLHPAFEVSGLLSVCINEPHSIPAYGLLNLLNKKLTPLRYTYGIVHLIT